MKLGCLLMLLALPAAAAEPVSADFIARDFRFHTGEVMPELRLHYTTLGAPGGEPVLVLHGTAGAGAGMLAPAFADALFGPGKPLDAATHYIILPDSIGAGDSSKPSDGMRAAFPHYDYADMVEAQHRLVIEGLHLNHLRLVLGNSMGGMHAWLWAVTYPDLMDAVVPMAAQPAAMSARNWMMRRMLIQSITSDPAYDGGNYAAAPPSLRLANVMFGIATSGGTMAYAAQAPTTARADAIVDRMLAAPPPADANDFIYQWDASRDYDPAPRLARITAPVLAINSADDERNPPETGTMERGLAQVARGRLYLIPASAETRGHGTTGLSRFWADQLAAFLAETPRRAM